MIADVPQYDWAPMIVKANKALCKFGLSMKEVENAFNNLFNARIEYDEPIEFIEKEECPQIEYVSNLIERIEAKIKREKRVFSERFKVGDGV